MKRVHAMVSGFALGAMTIGCATHSVTKRGSIEVIEGVSASTVVNARELERVVQRGLWRLTVT